MEIEARQEGDVKVVVVQGHLETTCVSEFRDKFLKETTDDKRVVLDCSDLSYLDSSGLAALVSILKSMNSKQAEMVICGLSEGIRKVIEFTKLDKVFNLTDSLEGALEKVRS